VTKCQYRDSKVTHPSPTTTHLMACMTSTRYLLSLHAKLHKIGQINDAVQTTLIATGD